MTKIWWNTGCWASGCFRISTPIPSLQTNAHLTTTFYQVAIQDQQKFLGTESTHRLCCLLAPSHLTHMAVSAKSISRSCEATSQAESWRVALAVLPAKGSLLWGYLANFAYGRWFQQRCPTTHHTSNPAVRCDGASWTPRPWNHRSCHRSCTERRGERKSAGWRMKFRQLVHGGMIPAWKHVWQG